MRTKGESSWHMLKRVSTVYQSSDYCNSQKQNFNGFQSFSIITHCLSRKHQTRETLFHALSGFKMKNISDENLNRRMGEREVFTIKIIFLSQWRGFLIWKKNWRHHSLNHRSSEPSRKQTTQFLEMNILDHFLSFQKKGNNVNIFH